MLKLRAKSTTQSHRTPVYYVDICLRDGVSLEDAVAQAKSAAVQQAEAGVDIDALEQAARTALANGAFEDSVEEAPAVAEEFYPEGSDGEMGEGSTEKAADQATAGGVASASRLSERLATKAAREKAS